MHEQKGDFTYYYTSDPGILEHLGPGYSRSPCPRPSPHDCYLNFVEVSYSLPEESLQYALMYPIV